MRRDEHNFVLDNNEIKKVFIITLVIYIIFTSVYQLMQQAEMLAG